MIDGRSVASRLDELELWILGEAPDYAEPPEADEIGATFAEAVRMIDQRDLLLELFRRILPHEPNAELRATMSRIIALCEGRDE